MVVLLVGCSMTIAVVVAAVGSPPSSFHEIERQRPLCEGPREDGGNDKPLSAAHQARLRERLHSRSMLALPPYVNVWLLLVLAWATNFIIRIGFSALLPPIMAELGLSYTRAGMLASAFFRPYAQR